MSESSEALSWLQSVGTASETPSAWPAPSLDARHDSDLAMDVKIPLGARTKRDIQFHAGSPAASVEGRDVRRAAGDVQHPGGAPFYSRLTNGAGRGTLRSRSSRPCYLARCAMRYKLNPLAALLVLLLVPSAGAA